MERIRKGQLRRILFKHMSVNWFHRFGKTVVGRESVGKTCKFISKNDLELSFRLFNASVPLTNYNRIPYRCNILESAISMSIAEVDTRLNIRSNETYKDSEIYKTLVSQELYPEKFPSVSLGDFDRMMDVLIYRKLKPDVLGWFNYYPDPTSYAYSKVLAILYKSNPKLCLKLYKKRQAELLPERDIYLDNNGLKCYLLFGEVEKARLLFNTIKKDDCTYANLMSYYVDKSDMVEAEKIFQSYKETGIPMSVGSVGIFADYLLQSNRYDELHDLLSVSSSAFPKKFGIFLSIAIFEAIKHKNVCPGISRRLIEDFEGMQHFEVCSILEYYEQADKNVFINSSFDPHTMNPNVNLTRLLQDDAFPKYYINHKTDKNWIKVASIIKELKINHLKPVTISIIFKLISSKVLISREVDAQIITFRLLNKPLDPELQSYLDNDAFLQQIFGLLTNHNLLGFNDLVRMYAQLAIFHPYFSDVTTILNKYNADVRLRLWIIERWFNVNQDLHNEDFKQLADNINLVFQSDRAQLWGKHYYMLFTAYLKKRRLYPRDKFVYNNLLMNFTKLRAEDLKRIMHRYMTYDRTFAVELYETYSPITNGYVDQQGAVLTMYWKCLSKDKIINHIQENLGILKEKFIEKSLATTVLQKVETVPDSLLKKQCMQFLRDRLQSTTVDVKGDNHTNILTTDQAAFLHCLAEGLKLAE